MSNAPPRRPAVQAERGSTPERSPARGRSRRSVPALPLPELLAHLDAVSTNAELECVNADEAGRASAGLLAQTSRALHALVWPLRDAEPAALWEGRRRVMRMRTWLRARTADVQPDQAIALCDQALDTLAVVWRTRQHAAGRTLHDTQEFETEFGGGAKDGAKNE